jgi:hypothetical protein
VVGGEASPTPSGREDEEEALLLDPFFRSLFVGPLAGALNWAEQWLHNGPLQLIQ